MDINTDIIIVGAGPCGLFAVFEAGLLKMRCHLIDYLPIAGGQLSEIYPKKPIYDIPGYPEILASDLVTNLLKQIEPFKPGFTLGERAETLLNHGHEGFEIVTHLGTRIKSKVIVIAGGLGCFEPRKPELEHLTKFEDHGVDYIIKDPEKYRGKHIVIAGGGDSALDWCIYLADIAASIHLIHRRSEFRAAPESVEKLKRLSDSNKIKLIVNAELNSLKGNQNLEGIVVMTEQGPLEIETEYLIPLFGLSPKLGPIADWGLQISKSAIDVNTLDYSTNIPGIYAIGDINNYPGKLKLILCGFHEATLTMQSAYKILNEGKKPSFKYTTVTGINNL
ncbi:MAG: NAD(P)/FAD-dependent oxidoreductase [Saprospiraceae bacterium]|nr:NAD(P)/FAD-dependent oxidoreductase [Saprospiraceae bacterium]MBK8295937.1 NAD(P)/FAD-dependent oxidoreductase [Saprospiraceae bacterium]